MAEDGVQLQSADDFVLKLYARRSLQQHLCSALRWTCIVLALFLSVYSVSRLSRMAHTSWSELEDMRGALSMDEVREDNQLLMIQALNKSITSLSNDLSPGSLLSQPDVMFDCYRVNRLSRAAVITYDGCFVDTTDGAMNSDTGIFKVRVPGVYQITFTAKYVSSSKGRFGAWSDVFVNETVIADSQREYNGNDLSSSESSTHTILVLYSLRAGDLVKVQFNKDGASYIHSDNDHDVHFTARRLSDLPETTSGSGVTAASTSTSTSSSSSSTPATVTSSTRAYFALRTVKWANLVHNKP